MSGKTSTESKRRYNKESYATHLYVYRKNSELFECIKEFKSKNGTSLNYLITKLLSEHFDVPIPIPETDFWWIRYPIILLFLSPCLFYRVQMEVVRVREWRASSLPFISKTRHRDTFLSVYDFVPFYCPKYDIVPLIFMFKNIEFL